MKKLYLLLDEWDNDRNFVGRELEMTAERYDVTVICNSAGEDLNPKVKYIVYKRPGKLNAVVSGLKMLADRDAWHEFGRVLREDSGIGAKMSEAIRFYINADLFRSFMKKNGFFEDGAIYYSYWYFWKCYAVTHEAHRYPGSRIITRTHEYDLFDYTSPSGYQPFKESMDGKLDSIIFISEHGREYYLRKYGKKSGPKYKLYHLGTVDPWPDKDDEDMIGDRKPDEEFVLVSCSSIIERKRVYRIAESLSLIDGTRVRWIHFGTGEKEDELKRLCKDKLEGKDNILYELKGYVKNEELHEYYRNNRVDAFITASSSEGNPVSVMEALSYAIPVIAPSICNFPNMITDCGILVSDKCEAEEMAAAIGRIAKMPYNEIMQLRVNARKCWNENYNADKNNRKFISEVIDVIGAERK